MTTRDKMLEQWVENQITWLATNEDEWDKAATESPASDVTRQRYRMVAGACWSAKQVFAGLLKEIQR